MICQEFEQRSKRWRNSVTRTSANSTKWSRRRRSSSLYWKLVFSLHGQFAMYSVLHPLPPYARSCVSSVLESSNSFVLSLCKQRASGNYRICPPLVLCILGWSSVALVNTSSTWCHYIESCTLALVGECSMCKHVVSYEMYRWQFKPWFVLIHGMALIDYFVHP